MSTDANKAIIRRHFEAIWNQGHLAVADEIVAPTYVSHFPLPGQPPGIAGFKYAVQLLRTSFPDLHLTIDDLIAEGDKVVARLTARGTHLATFRGIPATGQAVTWTGIRIFRIAEGKIVEHWANWDDLGLVQQLGSGL
jgi:steroid delta-isomerase-like uncharacterized protein